MSANFDETNLPIRDTLTTTWKISNFSKAGKYAGHHIASSKYPNVRFELGLYSKEAMQWLTNDVFLLFYLTQKDTDVLMVQYKVAIVDKNGFKQHSKDVKWIFNSTAGHSVFKYMSRSELMNPELLPNDTLPLEWEVKFFGEPSNSAKLNSIVDNLDTVVQSAILVARSPFFSAMFDHVKTQENQNETKNVKFTDQMISDMPMEVCDLLVRFLYINKIDQKSVDKFAEELFETADKSQINLLKSICSRHLSTKLTTESVSRVLLLAESHNAKELKQKCIEYIKSNMKKVVSTSGWKILTQTQPEIGFALLNEFVLKS